MHQNDPSLDHSTGLNFWKNKETKLRGKPRTGNVHTPVSQSRARVGVLAAVIGLAAALNCLESDVIGGARFFLGTFVIIPFVLSSEPVWAILAAMLAMAPTIVTLGQPFAFLLSGLEATWLVLGLRYSRRHAIVVDGAFWLLAGLLLMLWWNTEVGYIPRDLAGVMFATRAVTGIAAVATGSFVLHHTALGGRLRGGDTKASTVREVIFNSVFILSLVPLTFVVLGVSMVSRREVESEANERAFYAAHDAVREIDLFFEMHQSALVSVARECEQSSDRTASLLEETKRTYPRFLTMLVADATGHITQIAPGDQLTRLRGTSVADRDYFRAARDSRRPFVSGVFRGRGFGHDTLVAMSIPMFSRSGNFLGIVEASVRVDWLAEVAGGSNLPQNIQLVLADSAGRVIFADKDTGLHSLQRVQDTTLAPMLKSGAGMAQFTSDRIEPDGTARRVSNRAERCRTVGILVIAQWPILNALDSMKTAYAMLAAILLGIVGTAALVARMAHRRLSAPLERFARHTTRQFEAGAAALIPPAAGAIPQEVAKVFETFNRLAERLNETMAQLHRDNAELDRRVAERTHEAEKSREEAEAANQAKSDFLAMTSHEIRTPLNAMRGLAEVVAANPADPQAPERLRTIHDSGARLLGVVNDLLDLSRAEAGKLELRPAPVELGALCAELRTLFSLRAAQQGLRFEFAVAPPLPCWLETDGPRLQQVLINLIGNAFKFTPTGGITVRIELINQRDTEVELRFAVVDTGPGISPEEQKRLFQPYVQLAGAASNRHHGTGLGLSISRRLVALFGGELTLRSEPGKGAEFFFTIVAFCTAPPSSVIPEESELSALADLRVLAADDNAINREVLRGLLGQQFSHLELVDSGRDAIRALQEKYFDIAIIDLEMPEMDGFQVACTVRSWHGMEASRTCRLIAFSAHHRAEIWERCDAAGFDDFVEKPVERCELHRALTDCSTLGCFDCNSTANS